MGQLPEEQFIWPGVDSCMQELTVEQFIGQLTEVHLAWGRQLYAGQLTEEQFIGNLTKK